MPNNLDFTISRCKYCGEKCHDNVCELCKSVKLKYDLVRFKHRAISIVHYSQDIELKLKFLKVIMAIKKQLKITKEWKDKVKLEKIKANAPRRIIINNKVKIESTDLITTNNFHYDVHE